MLYTGLFKRILPFALTFAVGLFVASFFVSIALPTLGNWREARRTRDCHGKQQLRRENEELRQKYYRLVEENEELRRQAADVDVMIQTAVPPVELEAPQHHPPAPPKRPKHPRFER